MISCIEWIPRNVADPKPKRYELSKAERELLEQDVIADADDAQEEEDNDDVQTSPVTYNDISSTDKVHVPIDVEKTLTATEIIAQQKIDPSSLPKELRMDEYSDDENDENDANNNRKGIGAGIGDLLIGNDDTEMIGIDENGKVEDHIEHDKDSDDDEFDDDDDLHDIPDTREYIPTDLKGLEAMSFGGYAGIKEFEGADNEDDDSDIEDTNLKPDDALVIVAKTEEVSFE